MKCKKCKKGSIRIKVNLYLDIPIELHHRLSKTNLRSKDIQIEGAGWPTCTWYCTRCPWTAKLG